MTSYLSSFFSRTLGSAMPVKPADPATLDRKARHFQLPSGFYRSEAVYELEKIAIFSKFWLLVCHEKFLLDTNKFRLVDIAGLSILVFRDETGEIHAYRNSCSRTGERTLEVAQETDAERLSETGKLTYAGCGTCGWEYNADSALDASSDTALPGFTRSQHCLPSLRMHTDCNGFIYVNADNSPSAMSWEDQFADFDKQDRFDGVDFENYVYNRSWGLMSVPYNWKVLVDNYNECYHCAVAHPGFRATTDLQSYRAVGHKGHIAHYVKPKEVQQEGDESQKKFAFNFMMPSSSHTITPQYWHIMRILPTSHRTINVLYDTFRHKDCTDEEFNDMHDFIVQVVDEDKALCVGVQQSMEAGVYQSGPLHPERESGVIHFQKWYLEQMQAYSPAVRA